MYSNEDLFNKTLGRASRLVYNINEEKYKEEELKFIHEKLGNLFEEVIKRRVGQ